jgi:hypothetical protein
MVASVVASSIVGALLVAVVLARTTSLRINWASLLTIVASSIAAFSPLFFVNPHGVWAVLATIPCLILYSVLLVMFGELGKEDLNRVRLAVRLLKSSDDQP